MEIKDKDGMPTESFFYFLRYNQTRDHVELSKNDKVLYEEFCKYWKDFISKLENGGSPSGLLGNIASIFGFKRHYCGTCGIPIVGRFSKIGNMATCGSCYDSYKIVRELNEKEEIIKATVEEFQENNNE